MSKNKITLDVSGNENIFEDSYVGGAAKVSGGGNEFKRTTFAELQQEHPFWFWFGIAGALASIVSLLLIIL